MLDGMKLKESQIRNYWQVFHQGQIFILSIATISV